MLILFFLDWFEKIAVWPISALKRDSQKFVYRFISFQTAHDDKIFLLGYLRYPYFLFLFLGNHE
jgi:hypothetical protein